MPDEPSTSPGQAARPRRRRTFAITLAGLLLVPVALLAVLRVADIPGGLTDTLVSFTPYAVPLALIAAALAGVGRSVIATLAAGALLLLHALWLAPVYVPDGPTVRGPDATVATINLQYGNGDPEQVVDLVRDGDVEILSIQELTPRALEGLRAAGLDDVLPHRHVAPVSGTAAGTGIWSTRPLDPVSFGNKEPTAFENLRATVTLRGGVEVEVLAVHPHPPLPTTSERWRNDIAEVARVSVPGDRPMIVAGDFNMTRDHGPMREFEQQGLVDAADQAGAGYVPTWGPGGPLPRLFEIDHVLVSGDDIRSSDVSRHVIDGSDHKAVVADLTISSETASPS